MANDYRQDRVIREQVTGSSDISKSVNPGAPFDLCEVRLSLSAAGGANNLTITVNDGTGAAYDTILLTQDMTTATDVVYHPDGGPHPCFQGDTIDVAWTNTNNRTYGLTVIYQLK